MGLHASYFHIEPTTLINFVNNWNWDYCERVVLQFRKQSTESGNELYVGTTWHVLDYIINPPDANITELAYAVLGHGFPAPDGSVRREPHFPSYGDEYWQVYTYVTAEEVKTIAQYLSLIDDSEFERRYIQKKLKRLYHAPGPTDEERQRYFELLVKLQNYYRSAAGKGMAMLINIS